MIVDYRDYFSPEELGTFIPAFVEEGQIGGQAGHPAPGQIH